MCGCRCVCVCVCVREWTCVCVRVRIYMFAKFIDWICSKIPMWVNIALYCIYYYIGRNRFTIIELGLILMLICIVWLSVWSKTRIHNGKFVFCISITYNNVYDWGALYYVNIKIFKHQLVSSKCFAVKPSQSS